MGYESKNDFTYGELVVDTTGYSRDVNPASPTYGSLSSYSYPTSRTTRAKTQVFWNRTSQGTPGYRKLQASGQRLPMHPFEYRKVSITFASGSYSYITIGVGGPNQELETFQIQNQAGVGGYLAVEADSPVIDGKITDDLDRKCRTSVLLKCQNQKVNLAQLFAERAQTSKLVLNTATTIFKVVSSLKKGNVVKACEALGVVKPSPRKRKEYRKQWELQPEQAAASKWLELQYGWKPLLQDIYGAAETVANAPFAKPHSVRSRQATSRSTSSNTYRSGDPTSIRRESELSYNVTYHLEYMVTMPALQSAGAMGLLNPAQVAWELVPFSFVVDWFLPVGNFVQQFGATAGLTFVEGRKTIFSRGNSSCTAMGHPVSGRFGSTGHHGQKTGTRQEVNVTRVMLDAFPAPALPVLKNPFSAGHVANATALLTTLFPRKG